LFIYKIRLENYLTGFFVRFQDGGYREETESMPLKVKSWRDAGDTPYRKKH
jgi:hypothetical protein